MKKIVFLVALLVLTIVFSKERAFAGPPFINLEGVGGVAFNPLAYVADSGDDGEHFKVGKVDISAPRFGGWYVNLPDAKIDWTSFGVATAINKRLEISYGHETVAWVGLLNVILAYPCAWLIDRWSGYKVLMVYFAGEVLDVNGKRGGYNLGWAWASGYVAGQTL